MSTTMTDDHLDTISAVIDGEPVDERTLAAALGAPDAHDVLVEFLLLRAVTNSTRVQPASAPTARRPWRSRRGLVLALAAVLLAGVIGTSLYLRAPASRRDGWAPPSTERVVRLEPGRNWGFVHD
jgi:hypothetical protein